MSDLKKVVQVDVELTGAQKVDGFKKDVDGLNDNFKKATDSSNNFKKSNDATRKSVLESGGSMGLLGAATGGVAMDFKDAVEAAGDFGISLKGVRGAIIATGIGALAIILLELVSNWDKWSGVIDGSTSKLEALNKELDITLSSYI